MTDTPISVWEDPWHTYVAILLHIIQASVVQFFEVKWKNAKNGFNKIKALVQTYVCIPAQQKPDGTKNDTSVGGPVSGTSTSYF